MIISFLKRIYNRSQFNPGYIGLFISFNYFIRKGLYEYFKKHSYALTGYVLDFGAGESPYKHLLTYEKYITLDIEKSGHDNSQNEIHHYYNGRNIPFPKETFDSIIATEVFEHIFNLEEVLVEINRVLKKNGKLYITIPFSWEEHEIPYDFARYTPYGIRNILEKAGFKVLFLEKTGNYIEVIFQYITSYILSLFPKSRNKYIKSILFPIKMLCISPINIIGSILSTILPKNDKIFLNTIILATKQ